MRRPLEETVNATVTTMKSERYELAVRLRHSPDDPLAVRLDLYVTDADPPVATWVFGRDLLATGLILPSGDGDVRVRPRGGDRTDVELVSGRTWCVVRMASSDVRDFVTRTRSAEECADAEIDAALDRMLSEILPGGVKNADP
ncbi:SsgA family sporulation/cell division regulator [Streptomyces sp. NPDC059063]|uniref:SsgA family sporulation/cell division regulator n=1 Tax=unclassified Streptomyces TaxID=2593676 RepID=UPI00367CD883